MRLDKFLANQGIASRRGVLDLVRRNLIEVNGDVAKMASLQIDPEKDEVKVDGEIVEFKKNVYFLVNKPKGVISTTSDELGRKTVTSLIDSVFKLYPIGRLDEDTTGAIILTNDGVLTHLLTHPKFHIEKTYQLLVKGYIPREKIEKLENGVKLKEGLTLPAKVKILKKIKGDTLLELKIHEGKHRQIRRMCGVLGIDLVDLKRVAIGKLELGELKIGDYRELSKEEVESLSKK